MPVRCCRTEDAAISQNYIIRISNDACINFLRYFSINNSLTLIVNLFIDLNGAFAFPDAPDGSRIACPPYDLAPAAAGLLLAGLVKGVTGIGYSTCAMPLLALAVGLETAMALVVMPAIVSNAALIATGGRLADTARRFSLFYLAILPGIACGVGLLAVLDRRMLTQGLGLVTLAYVGLAIARPALTLSQHLERPLALPAGFLNGVLTGLTGSQILPLVPYMLALRLEPATQVQAINLAVTIASLAMGGALLANGIMSAHLLLLSCAGALLAISGVAAGNALSKRLPVETLRRLTLAMLAWIGLTLIGLDAIAAMTAGGAH